MSVSDGLLEFWGFNDTRKGSVLGIELFNDDSVDRYVPGIVGNAWAFDATANSVLSGNIATLLASTDSFSIGFWWRHTSVATNANRALVDIWSVSASLASLNSYRPSSYQTIRASSNAALYVSYNTSPRDTAWHSCVYSFDKASGNVNGWIDGTNTSGTTSGWTGFAGTPNSLTIGGPAAKTPLLAVDMDCVAIWNRALTVTDSVAFYNGGAGWEYTPPTPPVSGVAAISAVLLVVVEESNGVRTEKRIPLGVA